MVLQVIFNLKVKNVFVLDKTKTILLKHMFQLYVLNVQLFLFNFLFCELLNIFNTYALEEEQVLDREYIYFF